MGTELDKADSGHSASSPWFRVGLWLVVATMAYNVIEAVIALWSGAEADSIALIGFGLDSLIECVAAGALLWRLWVEARGAKREHVERAERRVHQVVGATFVVLAIYVTGQAGWTLWRQAAPEESTVGIVLAIASLIIMPLVSWASSAPRRSLGARPCVPRHRRPWPARISRSRSW